MELMRTYAQDATMVGCLKLPQGGLKLINFILQSINLILRILPLATTTIN